MLRRSLIVRASALLAAALALPVGRAAAAPLALPAPGSAVYPLQPTRVPLDPAAYQRWVDDMLAALRRSYTVTWASERSGYVNVLPDAAGPVGYWRMDGVRHSELLAVGELEAAAWERSHQQPIPDPRFLRIIQWCQQERMKLLGVLP